MIGKISLAPLTIKGNLLFVELNDIPIFFNGFITLSMGLLLRDESPTRVAIISLPPIAPKSILASVPLFPQSICLLGVLKPFSPTPIT